MEVVGVLNLLACSGASWICDMMQLTMNSPPSTRCFSERGWHSSGLK